MFEGEQTDVAISAWHDSTPGFERSFVERAVDFYTSQRFQLLDDGSLVRIDTPEDARISAYREWLLVRPRSPWTVGDTTYPAGSLLAAKYDDFLTGSCELTVLFEPDEHTSLEQYSWTRNHLLMVTLSDVQSHVHVLTPGENGWKTTPLEGLPELTSTEIIDTDPRESDDFFLNSSGYSLRRPCSPAPSADRSRRSSRRPPSSTPPDWPSPSTSPSPRTAPASPTSWCGARARPQVRRCCTATAASRTR